MKPTPPPRELARHIEGVRDELIAAGVRGIRPARASRGASNRELRARRALKQGLLILCGALALSLLSIVIATVSTHARKAAARAHCAGTLLSPLPDAACASAGPNARGALPDPGLQSSSVIKQSLFAPLGAHLAMRRETPEQHAALFACTWFLVQDSLLAAFCFGALALPWIGRSHHSRALPAAPMDAQPCIDAAVATHRGAVREHNEDTIKLITVPDARAIVVADGLGGHAEGAQASRYAVARTAAFLDRHLSAAAPSPELVLQLLAETFARTARLHAHAARHRGYSDTNDGMRTTLAIAVATKDAFVTGMLGDGAVKHMSSEGVRELLAPQREDGRFVGGSLGAVPSGQPSFRVVARGEGPEAVLVATDGIGDIATDDTYREVARAAWSRGAEHAAALLVNCVCKKTIDGSAIATDNVSVGLLASKGTVSCQESENA